MIYIIKAKERTIGVFTSLRKAERKVSLLKSVNPNVQFWISIHIKDDLVHIDPITYKLTLPIANPCIDNECDQFDTSAESNCLKCSWAIMQGNCERYKTTGELK